MILFIGAFFFWPKSIEQQQIAKENAITTPVIPVAVTVAPTANTQDSKTQNNCEVFKTSHADLNLLKQNDKPDIRYQNTHIKMGEKTYRLRRFFKDGDENEIESFLVYLENAQGDPELIEKKTYKKGKLYLKLEAAKAPVIYQEVGLNLANNLFLQYINGQLKMIQGQSLNCQF